MEEWSRGRLAVGGSYIWPSTKSAAQTSGPAMYFLSVRHKTLVLDEGRRFYKLVQGFRGS